MTTQLTQLIQKEIQQQGPMTFYQFMSLALYHPEHGYYSHYIPSIGKAGDFVTAPTLSPLFAYCIAKQAAEILEELAGGDILEIGAGTGILAANTLLALEKMNCLPAHYFIIEVSPKLQHMQHALLQAECPHLLPKVQWLSDFPSSFKGIMVANEVLDALPVHRCLWDNNNYQEWYVVIEEDETFGWKPGPVNSPQLHNLMKNLHTHYIKEHQPYTSEINAEMIALLERMNRSLERGLILLIDYGFACSEYYHPQRTMGTLMCHSQHRAHSDVLWRPGTHDITAHVDFTHVAEIADENGLAISGFTTQAAFLLSCDILSLVNTLAKDEKTRFQFNQQIKILTQPQEMGELFKVMALTRDVSPHLGFQWHDLRGKL